MPDTLDELDYDGDACVSLDDLCANAGIDPYGTATDSFMRQPIGVGLVYGEGIGA